MLHFFLLLLFVCGAHSAQPCTDQPHFNYKCTQLMKYCEQPQAMRIRKSCPLTCGMCRSNSAERLESGLLSAPPIFHQFNRAIKRESLSKAQVPLSAVISETFFNRPTPLLPKGKSLSVAVPEVFVTDEVLTDGLKFVSSERGITTKQVENDLLECCKGNFIASDCLSLCSYDVEPKHILEKAFKGVCSEQDANIWLRCTSAGNQDVDCCKKEKVVGCENLCNGRFSILEMMTCINAHLQPLLQCHKDALLNAR